jgi:hypothetical protein
MVRSIRGRLVGVPLLVGMTALALTLNCSGHSDDGVPDCADLCEKGLDDCPELPRVDCQSQCLYEDARAERTGCHDEVDAVARCSAGLDDICTTKNACKPEIDRFWTCVAAYCVKHPGSQYCQLDEDG